MFLHICILIHFNEKLQFNLDHPVEIFKFKLETCSQMIELGRCFLPVKFSSQIESLNVFNLVVLMILKDSQNNSFFNSFHYEIKAFFFESAFLYI